MSETWKHPQLGTFNLNDRRDSWLGSCSMPAFGVFTWELKSGAPSIEYPLVFEGTEDREPSAVAVAVALRVIANQAGLPSMIASALWDEFNGRGPESGMWWCGGMDQVRNFGYAGRSVPTRSDDLLTAMRFSGVWIREGPSEDKNPIAQLAFSALFEQEHGVGILTDGSKILGTGYMFDVSTYR